MILWNWHKREIEAKARAEGYAEGFAEARAEGYAEGRAQNDKLWGEWNARRLEAEKNKEKFDEPPPSETQAD